LTIAPFDRLKVPELAGGSTSLTVDPELAERAEWQIADCRLQIAKFRGLTIG
jgi:hypothetical protein